MPSLENRELVERSILNVTQSFFAVEKSAFELTEGTSIQRMERLTLDAVLCGVDASKA
jgi:hypothetical protein